MFLSLMVIIIFQARQCAVSGEDEAIGAVH